VFGVRARRARDLGHLARSDSPTATSINLLVADLNGAKTAFGLQLQRDAPDCLDVRSDFLSYPAVAPCGSSCERSILEEKRNPQPVDFQLYCILDRFSSEPLPDPGVELAQLL
jgi:hypothetical protein